MKFIRELTNKIIFNTETKNKLGRWFLVSDIGEKRCHRSLDIIIKQANMDNCGDRLCGIPQTEDKLINSTKILKN